MLCTVCGRENAEDSRFCNGCGSELTQVDAPERRKLVTVLFCDLADSTALGERLDPETLKQILFDYYGVARTAVERHGGVVEKFIGDAVMAVFGVPSVREDDAYRAVRAAWELRGALKELNDRLEPRYGIRLSARIGVNTGETMTAQAGTLALGDAVNVAARLEQLAEPASSPPIAGLMSMVDVASMYVVSGAWPRRTDARRSSAFGSGTTRTVPTGDLTQSRLGVTESQGGTF